MSEHPFIGREDDEPGYQPLSTATELVLVWGQRSTPLTICLHNSHERSPERDATILATALQTTLDQETFKITAMLMFQMLQMRMQQHMAQHTQLSQMFSAEEDESSTPPESE